MGNFGKLTKISDLPSDDIIAAYLVEALQLNIDHVKLPKTKASDRKELDIPSYFMEAVSADSSALATFERFSYSNQKEYVEWVVEAKRDATREKRLAQAVEWMAEGKIRNWKYVNC